jgi:hypothetical protein
MLSVRTGRAILMLAVLAACAGDRDEALVRFQPGVAAGIQPEIDSRTGSGEYSLIYQLSPDGSSLRMGFRGPSEALTAGFSTEKKVEGDEHSIVCRIGGSDFRATLARWKLDANGRVCEAWVRTKPVVEVRPYGEREPDQLAVSCEWRPLVNGKGSGPWRPPPGR